MDSKEFMARIWGKENSLVIYKKPLHAEKVHIGLTFLKTINVRLWQLMVMRTDYFWHNIEDCNVEDTWFQQDCHISGATLDVLFEKFLGCIISRFFYVNWPLRSFYLTPLFFAWLSLRVVSTTTNPYHLGT